MDVTLLSWTSLISSPTLVSTSYLAPGIWQAGLQKAQALASIFISHFNASKNRYPQGTRRVGHPSFPSLTIRVGISSHTSIIRHLRQIQQPRKHSKHPVKSYIRNLWLIRLQTRGNRKAPTASQGQHSEPLRRQHSNRDTGERKPSVLRQVQGKAKGPEPQCQGWGDRVMPL